MSKSKSTLLPWQSYTAESERNQLKSLSEPREQGGLLHKTGLSRVFRQGFAYAIAALLLFVSGGAMLNLYLAEVGGNDRPPPAPPPGGGPQSVAVEREGVQMPTGAGTYAQLLVFGTIVLWSLGMLLAALAVACAVKKNRRFLKEVAVAVSNDRRGGLVAYSFAIAALAIRLYCQRNRRGDPEQDKGTVERVFMAVAVTLAMLRQAQVLSFIPSIGPLVLTIWKVMEDLLKFMTILAVVILSFAGGLYAMYADSELYRKNCLGAYDDLYVFLGILLQLLEFAVNAEGNFECVARSEEPYFGIMLLTIYLILMAVLLLNMLIAVLTRTVDDVAEAQEVNFSLLLVQLLVGAETLGALPPPFNLLSLPFHFTHRQGLFARVIRPCLGSCCPSGSEKDSFAPKSSTTPRLPAARMPRAVAAEREKRVLLLSPNSWLLPSNSHLKLDVEREARFEEWRQCTNKQAIIDEVMVYVHYHEDEVYEEGKWRTRFAQKISMTRVKLEDQVMVLQRQQANVDAKLDAIIAKLSQEDDGVEEEVVEVDMAAGATRMPRAGFGEVGVWKIEELDLLRLDVSIADNMQGGFYVDKGAAGDQDERRGDLSPLHAVTLNAEKREKAKIPPTAKYYSFAYPLDLKSSKGVAFPIGGYVYFDTDEGGRYADLKACAANALHPSEDDEGFNYTGPIALGNKAPVWRDALKRQGRLHELPKASGCFATLRQIGVRHFCWLNPNEEVTPHNGSWPNGAFVFFYDDSSKDCVFKLSGVHEEPPPLKRHLGHGTLRRGSLNLPKLVVVSEGELVRSNSARANFQQRVAASYSMDDLGRATGRTNSLGSSGRASHSAPLARFGGRDAAPPQPQPPTPIPGKSLTKPWSSTLAKPTSAGEQEGSGPPLALTKQQSGPDVEATSVAATSIQARWRERTARKHTALGIQQAIEEEDTPGRIASRPSFEAPLSVLLKEEMDESGQDGSIGQSSSFSPGSRFLKFSGDL